MEASARTMYLCILERAGTIVLHQEVPAEPAAFLQAIAPFRNALVVAYECLFCWYWLADLCHSYAMLSEIRPSHLASPGA
jgi:hypothetical protein